LINVLYIYNNNLRGFGGYFLYMPLVRNQVKLCTAGEVVTILFAQGTEADVTGLDRLVEEYFLRFAAAFQSALLDWFAPFFAVWLT